MPHEKLVLINTVLEKAIIALETAKDNIELHKYEGTINRTYYAIFYVVSALAIKNNFSTSSHAQLKGWFNKKFIYEDKIFDEKMYNIYKNAYLYREKSDYDFTYMPDLETAKTMLKDAKIFVKKIVQYLS